MKKIALILIVACIIISCSGKHCIKVGGSYEGIQGDLEYCFDANGIKELSSPIVTDNAGNKFLGISEKEASIILDKMEKKEENAEIKSEPVLAPEKEVGSVFSRLKKILK